MTLCDYVKMLESELISSIIGGLISGFVTFWAVNKTIKHEKEKDVAVELDNLASLLRAVKTELESILDRYQVTLGKHLEEHKENEAFNFYYPITQSYFSVYDSNCDKLGKLDSILITQIVRTYTYIKGYVDGLIFHNRLVEQHQVYYLQYNKSGSPQDATNADLIYKQIKSSADSIKSEHFEIKKAIGETIVEINKAVKELEHQKSLLKLANNSI